MYFVMNCNNKVYDILGNKVYKIIPPEDNEGYIEYKWKLSNVEELKINKVTSQMRWRVKQGKKTAVYIIGVHDNGYVTGLTKDDFIQSYLTILDCAKKINMWVCIRKINIIKDVENCNKLYWGIIQIFKRKTKAIYDYELPCVPTIKSGLLYL